MLVCLNVCLVVDVQHHSIGDLKDGSDRHLWQQLGDWTREKRRRKEKKKKKGEKEKEEKRQVQTTTKILG